MSGVKLGVKCRQMVKRQRHISHKSLTPTFHPFRSCITAAPFPPALADTANRIGGLALGPRRFGCRVILGACD
jgi:hypothetical protein